MDAWKPLLRDLQRHRMHMPQRTNILDVVGPTRPDDHEVTEAIPRRPHGQSCKRCNLPGCTKSCARCMKVFYCSKSCQTCDWPTHKQTCKRLGDTGTTQSSAANGGTELVLLTIKEIFPTEDDHFYHVVEHTFLVQRQLK
ncbi:hypothetical protein DPMN_166635 [Dreissena polymorpha]|uniref:MYND-type domain-containing protein n=1 Tax=Dreissena polymorpha TaxID=45954 RepID=A0A9D4EZ83_DREPO|nr:hypothetical protein DPMN_166635 [Dreissena polymorpha]